MHCIGPLPSFVLELCRPIHVSFGSPFCVYFVSNLMKEGERLLRLITLLLGLNFERDKMLTDSNEGPKSNFKLDDQRSTRIMNEMCLGQCRAWSRWAQTWYKKEIGSYFRLRHGAMYLFIIHVSKIFKSDHQPRADRAHYQLYLDPSLTYLDPNLMWRPFYSSPSHATAITSLFQYTLKKIPNPLRSPSCAQRSFHKGYFWKEREQNSWRQLFNVLPEISKASLEYLMQYQPKLMGSLHRVKAMPFLFLGSTFPREIVHNSMAVEFFMQVHIMLS